MTMSAAIAMAVAATGCVTGDCYSSYREAMADEAPDDLDCKPDDIGYGVGMRGTFAEGCGRVAYYSCSSGRRRSSCLRCSLVRVEQY